MKDNEKNKEELIAELVELRQKLNEKPKNGGKPSLRADNDQAHHILQVMDDFIFVLDAENRFTSVYAPSERMEMSLEDMLGKKHADVMSAHNDAKFVDALERVKRGEVAEYDYKQQLLEETRWYTIKLTPIFEEGVYTGVVAVARDITERVQTEEALRKTDELFRLITENTPEYIGMTTFDLNATYTYLNKSVKAMLGYTPEELLGKSFFDFVHPEDKKVIFPLLVKYVNHKIKKLIFGKELPVNQAIEFRFKHKDGSWRLLHSNVNVAGKQLLGITRDITERAENERILRKNEARYRQLFNLLPYGGEVLDNKGIIKECSRSTAQMLGYEAHEIVGRHITEFVDAESATRFKAEFSKLLHGSTIRVSVNMKRKDGSLLHILRAAEPILNEDGEIESVLALNVDVTERVQAEKALQKSEKRFKKLSTLTFEGILLHNQGVVIDVNESLVKMFGITREEVIGQNIIEALVPREYHALIQENIVKDSTRPYEFMARRKDGVLIPVEVESRNVKGESEDYRVTAIRDITARRKSEQTLKELNAELEKMVSERAETLLMLGNATASRETRMAELKEVISKLRTQLEEAGQVPVADDPLAKYR